ncbi:MAG: fumarylacetoacetate hydrolase family protein [Chloroflexi bacterium AL-W]|nr:fumarylacetoacetate hydrolase family protein [Chloroflexi bacterium AL-N1]NOK66166.1 fumarylacetoacetate hydrolase family protein [Chloroflexi bacterium AL-N10]NOK73047.1 fumarylacetoacetate hydrolase family protein [Chloroflexi bacterium AL-N5]NOK79944.1 fumarylacetoacetate hydrolase family protein [Chloroflexi bacterium AL-W]NOK88200.1 fumarylacetoacetate hydrolase family protein [Chloroflexi bacterium AL-N15]
MRLVTYRDSEGIHIGALKDSVVVLLDVIAPNMLTLIDGGDEALMAARDMLERAEVTKSVNDVQLLAPIPRPRQNVVCIGMNYVAHAVESNKARGLEPKLPEYPVFFTKAPNTVCALDDEIPLDPRVTQQMDYEVELAYIIGRGGKNISRNDALSHVFGYTIVNDISARDLQMKHQQFYKSKSLERSCPMGPCIVTADEIPDPGVLGIRLRLNGEVRQESTTGDLIFDIPATIESLSSGAEIEAGMIVSTGTPSGVGMGRIPPEYLRVGDVMEAEVEGIGVLRNRIVAAQ